MNAVTESFLNSVSLITDLDRIGHLKAQIADLKKEQDTLIDAFKNAGEGTYEGNLFKGTVYMSQTVRVDYKAVCEAAFKKLAANLTEKEFNDFKDAVLADNAETTASIGFRLSAR